MSKFLLIAFLIMAQGAIWQVDTSAVIPSGQQAQVTDEYAIAVYSHAVVFFSGETVDQGKVYVSVAFEYQCLLAADQWCEDDLTIVSAIGQSGASYSYFEANPLFTAWNWQVPGGGVKGLTVVFELSHEDAEDFTLQFGNTDLRFEPGIPR